MTCPFSSFSSELAIFHCQRVNSSVKWLDFDAMSHYMEVDLQADHGHSSWITVGQLSLTGTTRFRLRREEEAFPRTGCDEVSSLDLLLFRNLSRHTNTFIQYLHTVVEVDMYIPGPSTQPRKGTILFEKVPFLV